MIFKKNKEILLEAIEELSKTITVLGDNLRTQQLRIDDLVIVSKNLSNEIEKIKKHRLKLKGLPSGRKYR